MLKRIFNNLPIHKIWRIHNLQLKNPIHFLALGCGSGGMVFAPGTFGTLFALPIMYALSCFITPYAYNLICILLCIIGIKICEIVSYELSLRDPSCIVLDEIVGFMVACSFILGKNIKFFLVAFILFRIFDIFKPYPISIIEERIDGGLGIMLDDIIAGIFAGLICYFLTPLLVLI